MKMAIGQSHDQPTASQNPKACRRVEKLMFDASLKGEWRSSGSGRRVGNRVAGRAFALAADLLAS